MSALSPGSLGRVAGADILLAGCITLTADPRAVISGRAGQRA
jgi:hypothetical protein